MSGTVRLLIAIRRQNTSFCTRSHFLLSFLITTCPHSHKLASLSSWRSAKDPTERYPNNEPLLLTCSDRTCDMVAHPLIAWAPGRLSSYFARQPVNRLVLPIGFSRKLIDATNIQEVCRDRPSVLPFRLEGLPEGQPLGSDLVLCINYS